MTRVQLYVRVLGRIKLKFLSKSQLYLRAMCICNEESERGWTSVRAWCVYYIDAYGRKPTRDRLYSYFVYYIIYICRRSTGRSPIKHIIYHNVIYCKSKISILHDPAAMIAVYLYIYIYLCFYRRYIIQTVNYIYVRKAFCFMNRYSTYTIIIWTWWYNNNDKRLTR